MAWVADGAGEDHRPLGLGTAATLEPRIKRTVRLQTGHMELGARSKPEIIKIQSTRLMRMLLKKMRSQLKQSLAMIIGLAVWAMEWVAVVPIVLILHGDSVVQDRQTKRLIPFSPCSPHS